MSEEISDRVKAVMDLNVEQGAKIEALEKALVIKKSCERAGIPYLTTHQLGSHTFATYMRKYAGADARMLVDTGRWAVQRPFKSILTP